MKWFYENRLLVNVDKTLVMLFGCHAPSIPNYTEILFTDPVTGKVVEIRTTNKTKYLGVTLQSNMKWKNHIQDILDKTRCMIFSFLKLRDIYCQLNI